MVVIKIFNVDCQNNEAPLTVLKSGEHILGRGCFPNCTHRKISRKHAILNVEENKATLTVVHVNPFFYISRASARVQILNKDVPVNLTDGDKFAFITDNWYKIQIVKEDSEDHPLNDGSTSTIPISVKDSSETVVASTSATVVSKAVSPLKRSLEELSSEGRKKLKTINQSLDELMKNIKQIESQDFPKNGSSETDNNKTFEMFRKKEVAESDDEDSDVETSDVTRDIEVVTSKEIGKLDCDKDVKSDSGEENNKDSDTEADLLKEPVIDKSNVPEGDLETNNLTTNREEVSDSDQDDTKEQEVKVPVDGNNLKEVDDNESSKQDQGNASTSTSGESMGKKLRESSVGMGQAAIEKIRIIESHSVTQATQITIESPKKATTTDPSVRTGRSAIVRISSTGGSTSILRLVQPSNPPQVRRETYRISPLTHPGVVRIVNIVTEVSTGMILGRVAEMGV
ncbi:hypothetical protein HHI36_003671 [Cryptolaemus montrouzieri]|uniref:FHA domain-containing protein n=1 Tax=Cryptolaemus montrouzieri TaxID=559131 RepID=A0ABD2PEP6_9CUCU